MLSTADIKERWWPCYSCTGGLGDVTLKVSVTERDRERLLSDNANVTGGKFKIMADNLFLKYTVMYIWYIPMASGIDRIEYFTLV